MECYQSGSIFSEKSTFFNLLSGVGTKVGQGCSDKKARSLGAQQMPQLLLITFLFFSLRVFSEPVPHSSEESLLLKCKELAKKDRAQCGVKSEIITYLRNLSYRGLLCGVGFSFQSSFSPPLSSYS
ncbi:hypothetical protein CEXT_120521 [Caerostris extrusa]|uniref:Uncharacterized protein n=1 Tax=Caerostris extrusa TaxID=172846 RepID=A0AAV4VUL4_CAEEX|nr:hypothetical protein CEXT_120521 [Caerostris extrusa]